MIQKPIRILRIIARLNIGGPAIQAIMLSKELTGDDFETLLVCGEVSGSEGDMAYLARKEGVDPIVITEFGRELSAIRDLKSYIRLISLIKEFRPHIIHTHTAKAGTLGRLAGLTVNLGNFWKNRIRFVHTFHGHVFKGYFSSFKTLFFQLTEKILARFTDRIVTISPLQKEDICKKYRIAKEDRVQIVPLGFDFDLHGDDRNSSGFLKNQSVTNLSNSKYIVGIIGRLTPIKNHRQLISAAKRLNDLKHLGSFHFLIVGDGELRTELEKTVESFGISDAVEFTGWQEDMRPVYAALDAVILTSKNEGTPVSLIEAMASGKVIISTRVGGVPDLLGRVRQVVDKNIQIAEYGILIPPDDTNALAEALLLVRNNPAEFVSRSQKASEYAVKFYSKERLLHDLKALYYSLF